MINNIKYFYLLLNFLFCFVGLAQDEENPLPVSHKESPFDIAPSFPGGTEALNAYFHDSIRYPSDERKRGKEGYVSMKFEVTKKGKIINIVPINGVPGAPNFVKESIRLLNSMPLWIPATKAGKAVQAEYFLSVPFALNGDRPKRKHRRKNKY